MISYVFHRLRTACWTGFYRLFRPFFFARLGAGTQIEGWIDMPQRGGRISIGPGVRIARGVEFTVLRNAQLNVHPGVFIGRGAVISVHERVDIERDAMVAEYVCIHDNNHRRSDPDRAIAEQGFDAAPIVIGEGSWIGAHAIILKGVTLGPNCVVGAGAVVTRSFPSHSTLVGVPARGRP